MARRLAFFFFGVNILTYFPYFLPTYLRLDIKNSVTYALRRMRCKYDQLSASCMRCSWVYGRGIRALRKHFLETRRPDE